MHDQLKSPEGSTRQLACAASELSAAQRGIWLGHQRSLDPTIYNCAEQITIDGPFCCVRFEAALAAAFDAARSLHFAFVEVDGVPKARSVAASLNYALLDLSREPDPKAAADRHARRLIETRLGIDVGELCVHRVFRLSGSRHVWLQLAHHIALDGYGFQLFAKAVAEHYNTGNVPDFAGFEAVLDADQSYQRSTQRRLDEAFWLQGPGCGARPLRLGGVRNSDPASVLPEPAAPLRVAAELPERFLTLVREVAASVGGRWPEALTAVVAAHLHLKTGRRRFALGAPVMLRLGTPALKVPCMAMNIVRVPVVVAPGTTLRNLTRDLSERQRLAAPHCAFRYEDLRNERFGPVVNILPFATPQRFGDATADAVGLAAGPVSDLAISFVQRKHTLRVVFDGHPDLYTEAELHALLGELCSEALAQLEHPDQPLVAFSAQRVVAESPDVVRAIVERASLAKGQIALVAAGQRLSYATLIEWASSLASRFAKMGAEPGNLVALDLPRSPEAVVVILGTLMAGCGYFALDTKHPASRRRDLLRQVRPALLVGSAPWELGLLPAEQPRWLSRAEVLECTSSGEQRATHPPSTGSLDAPNVVDPSDPAYVVFTSGSTGTPKGVVVSRAALSAYVEAAQQRYALRATDRVLQFASLAFDASVEELFVTLLAGATLVIRDQDMVESTSGFFEITRELEISVLNLPTAYWHELAWAVGRQQCTVPKCVHTVIIGGEAADATRVEQWLERVPEARLLNTYGPSEVTVVATCCDLSVVDRQDGVPIGTPLSGVRTFVVPVGEGGTPDCGELLLAGPTLADGYLDRPDLTRQRFVPAPDGMGRAYHTGDLVRKRADGQLVYLGRVDDELKISGYRIVPAEIEAALARHPAVRASVVMGRGQGSLRCLVAHVELDHTATPEDLRAFLGQTLPAQLIPTAWQVHPRLPRTTTGKLNRSALLHTGGGDSASMPAEQVAATPLEAAVLQTYRDVLGTSAVAPTDDFFALGGTSLQLIQVANRLSQLCAGLSVATLFAHPTPRALALVLDRMAAGNIEPSARQGFGQPLALELPRATSRLRRATAFDAADESAVIVLTGATGFVGVYLLAQLLERTRARVVCTVRARGSVAPRQRLEQQFRAYGLWHEELVARVEVVSTDLSSPELGRLLPSRCDQVVHAAADVSLVRDFDSLQAANVAATRRLLEYAGRSGADFHHVSTLAVVPASTSSDGAREIVYPGHAGLVDGYQQTKWQAEQLCEQAAALGHAVSIYRLGRVTGARDNPYVNPRDLVWRIARSSVRAQAWPRLDFAEPWIPVDDAATTLVDLVLRPAALQYDMTQVFHLAQTGSVELRRLRLALQQSGLALDTLPVADWVSRVRQVADDEDRATLAFFELLATRGAPKPLAMQFRIDRLLQALPGLKAEPVSDELLLRYCQRAIEDGLLRRA